MKFWIFKCENCENRFIERFSEEEEENVDIAHIAIKTHLVATHRCDEKTYGCGKLIGASEA